MAEALQPHPWTLRSVALEKVRAESRRYAAEEFDPTPPEQAVFEVNLARNEDRTGLLVYVRFFTEPREKAPYDFEVTWSAEFSTPPDASDKHAAAFAQSSGVLIIWPYARSYISELTTSMGFPPFLLATVAIPQWSPEEDKSPDRLGDGEMDTQPEETNTG